MRLALVALAACVVPQPEPLPEAQARVVALDLPLFAPQPIDIVMVVDDSPAMAPFRPHVRDGLRWAMSFIDSSWFDVHVAVIAADATSLHRTTAVDGAFLRSRFLPDGSRDVNYAGTLPDAVAAFADVGTTGSWDAQPLEAMAHALAARPAGFARDGALSHVAFIADVDDHSPRSLDAYELIVRAEREPPQLDAILPLPSLPDSRLAAFLARFPDVDVTSFRDPQPYFGPSLDVPVIASPCFDERVDPSRCTVALDGETFRAWDIVDDRANCTVEPHQAIVLHTGNEWPRRGAHVLVQCVVGP